VEVRCEHRVIATSGGRIVSQTAQSSAAPLSVSRELLELVLANLADGVLVVDATGARVYANAEAARLTGYPSAEALVRAPPEEAFERFEVTDRGGNPVSPSDLPGRRALLGDAPDEPVLLRFRRPGGSEHAAEVRAVAVPDETGTPAYAVTFFRDVTRRVAASDEVEALYAEARQTTALLDALYRSAPIGLGFWDRDLRYVRVNEALATINNRAPEDHVGLTFVDVVPNLADVLEPLARGVLETGEAVIARQITSGTSESPEVPRYWLASYYPVNLPSGERIGVGALVEEITDRRRAEQRTELQHAATRILVEANSLDEAMPRVVETICTTFGFDVGSYWSTDPDAPRLTWAQPDARLDGFLAVTERASLSTSMLPGRVAATGNAEWLADLEPDRFVRAPVALAEGLRSGVAFPVLVEGETVGVVELFSRARRELDEELFASLEALGGQLGQFLRRKRAEEERTLFLQREQRARTDAEKAAATLRKLERVAEAALEHLSLQDLLDSLLGRIVEVLEADTAAILLVGEDGHLHMRSTVGIGSEIERATPIPIGRGMAGTVAATRASLLVPDLSKIELVSPVLRDRGVNSVVAIPLIVEDRVIGVVHAGSEAYAQFVEEDARLLELIADRIALAINQVALFEAERAAQERLAFLSEASALLASSLDVEETLRRVARLAVPHFADWCAVDLVADDGTLQRVTVAHVDPGRVDLAERLAEAFPPLVDDEHGVGEVVRSGAARLDTDIELLRLGVGATLSVPLVVRDRPVGALTFVATDSRRRYVDTDLAFAQELASRAAVAVDNARLYRAAKRRRDQLAFLAEASALLGSALDVERTLRRLGTLLADRFADWSAIHLVGDDGRVRLATLAHRNEARAAAALEEALSGAGSRELPSAVRAAIAGAATERWHSKGEPEPGSFEEAEGLHSGIVVPLVARGRVLGTLSIVRGETPDLYDEDDVEFAEDIARRAAVAIDNAQLYGEAAVGRDRLGFLAEASAILGSSLDVDRTLEQLGALVAGRIADGCAIYLVGEDGPPRLVVVARGGRTGPVEEASASRPPAAVLRVIRTGEPELDDELPAELIVPLKARGRTFGAMSLVWAGPERRRGASDVDFALDLARRAAVAIDNAQLYGAAAERAQAARVLASVGDGVFLVDRAGFVRTWNRAAAVATGLPASAVIDRIAVEAIPGWASIVARVAVTAAGSSAPRPESLPLDLGGRELWLSIHGVAVPDGVVYAFRDLTEERALEQMRTEFVSTVSHELRTPLAAIYGAAMTLRRSDVALDEEQRARLLDVVSGEADRLARTVNDILWASRLDSDSLHVSIQNCDPIALVHDVTKAQEAHLDRAHELQVEAPDQLPLVAGDPDKVGRVLINLVDNAVKYSPDGGRVSVGIAHLGSHVRFSVSDEGLGIPPAEQRRVFEKFYRLDPNMNRGVGGTGLGLYICRELVRRMDGRIWVESAGLGRGSTFHVELPAVLTQN
jgi:PAS domain S-box-containing protein